MYFDKDFLDFYKELAANNNRDWFHANKKRYENSVKKPFVAFVSDVIQELKTNHDKLIDIEVKDAVYRINRDIRFSKDKSPYKLHSGAVISRGGRKDMVTPGLYVMFGPEQAHIGGGVYMPSKENLYAIREAIAKDPKGFEKSINNKDFKSHYPKGLIGEKNKVLPKEFKDASEQLPLLFNKQFYMMADHKPDIVLKKDILDIAVKHYVAAEPWNGFVRKALNIK